MAEYIERKALLDALYAAGAKTTARGLAILNQFPAADVRPVVRSHWEYHLAPLALKCAACHKKSHTNMR